MPVALTPGPGLNSAGSAFLAVFSSAGGGAGGGGGGDGASAAGVGFGSTGASGSDAGFDANQSSMTGYPGAAGGWCSVWMGLSRVVVATCWMCVCESDMGGPNRLSRMHVLEFYVGAKKSVSSDSHRHRSTRCIIPMNADRTRSRAVRVSLVPPPRGTALYANKCAVLASGTQRGVCGRAGRGRREPLSAGSGVIRRGRPSAVRPRRASTRR